MSESTYPFRQPPADMTEQEFVDVFGGVYEHSPWVARATYQQGLGEGQNHVAGLSAAMQIAVAAADKDQLLVLIKAHPDLAGKAAVEGQLTAESNSEQRSAGIDQCTAEEFNRFQTFNTAYKQKFGFPFIMAVKGSNRHKILAAFELRLKNDPETEFKCALAEINKIARLRLEAMSAQT